MVRKPIILNGMSISAHMAELYKCGAKEVLPCGSYFTCNPPVINTDIDFAVLVSDFFILGALHRAGYAENDEDHERYDAEDRNCFHTLRRGRVNLIIMTRWRYKIFEASTAIAMKLNLLEKADRVMLFQTMRDVLLTETAPPAETTDGDEEGDFSWLMEKNSPTEDVAHDVDEFLKAEDAQKGDKDIGDVSKPLPTEF